MAENGKIKPPLPSFPSQVSYSPIPPERPADTRLPPEIRHAMIVRTMVARGLQQHQIDRAMMVGFAESSGGRDLFAKTSRAQGEFQIIPASFKDTLDHLRKYEPETYERVSRLGITHPESQAVTMQFISERNERILTNLLHRPPYNEERYALHVFGPDGGKRLAQAMAADPPCDPNTPMASLVSAAALDSNKPFANMTLSQFRSFIDKRLHERSANTGLESISCDLVPGTARMRCDSQPIDLAALRIANGVASVSRPAR